MNPPRTVFITGCTGYIGRRLIPQLLARGHTVRALTRPGSEAKLPLGCTIIIGDALDAATYRDTVAGCDTFVQLVGVAHPGPAKAAQFRRVDLVSALAAIDAAAGAAVAHFIYLSVAQPAPVMRDYVAARAEAEAELRRHISNTTILRPWYVVGPGHRWPVLLQPAYWLAERLPAMRDNALRLGLVTIAQMLEALVLAVEQPAIGVRVLDVPALRGGGRCGG
jgi:uncharacterized protein YbjT (DUF2867 family)